MKDLKINNQTAEAPQVYEAPTIEVIDVEVEQGFAVTGGGDDTYGGGPGDGEGRD
jgi:hypothetical protein